MQSKKMLKGRWTEKSHSIFRLIHDTAAAIRDVSFSFEVAMTETDWMLPVVYRWIMWHRTKYEASPVDW